MNSKRRASIIFPSYSPLAENKWFIFIAFVLLVLKDPSNYVVSDMKGIKEMEIIYSEFTEAPLSHGGPEKFCVDGSYYKWKE